MSHKTPSEAEVADTLSHLTISTSSSASASKSAVKAKSKPVAESWDEELSSGSDTETGTETPNTAKTSRTPISKPLTALNTESDASETPSPPPPTPASPTPADFPVSTPYGDIISGRGAAGAAGRASPAQRPEKTTAVASRLIAGALGVRAPRRTAEEREYDKAMREKERKRREEAKAREKAEEEAREARKKAIWDD